MPSVPHAYLQIHDVFQRIIQEIPVYSQFCLQGFRQKIEIKTKSDPFDLVTEMDIAIQNILHTRITDICHAVGMTDRQIGFLGEENLHTPGEYTFVIDPIDGTKNYALGIPFFAISIAIMHGNQVIAGIISLPFERTVYTAFTGQGAYVQPFAYQQKDIAITQESAYDADWMKSQLQKHTSFTGAEKLSMKNQPPSHHLWCINNLSRAGNAKLEHDIKTACAPIISGTREISSTCADICYLAHNYMAVIISDGVRLWDIAAGKIIIEEAGGKICDWNQKSLVTDNTDPDRLYQYVAGNPEALQEVYQCNTLMGKDFFG